MVKIGINNQSGWEIDGKFVRNIVNKALEIERIKNREVSVVFLEKEKIRELNKRYRKLDKATDVLSFEGDKDSDFLGEIAVSPEVVERRSGGDFDGALAHVLIHGVLHLCGYDHIKIRDRKIMREKEKEILQSIAK